MAYIGNSPIVGNFQVCDAISVVNGQAAYTMQVSSANVSPESANHMLVSLNGILQKPGSSFTISGSTITFASNLATGDVIDFIILLGNVLDIGTPSDATVTDAKANFVSTSSAAGLQIKGDGTTAGAIQLNCEQNSHGIKLQSPAHSSSQSYTLKFPTGNVTADKFLKVASVSGSGTTGVGQLSFGDAGGGMYELIQTQTISSDVAQIDFTSTQMTTSHQDYLIICSGVRLAVDGASVIMRISSDGGSSFITTSSYDYGSVGEGSNGTLNTRESGGDNKIRLHPSDTGSATGRNFNAIIEMYDPLNQISDNKFFTCTYRTVSHDSNGTLTPGHGGGTFTGSGSEDTVFNGVRFTTTSGNFNQGVFSIYGRKIS